MKWAGPFFALFCVASGCSVPTFGYQTPAELTTNACRDGVLSPGEADVDCGQICNAPCASGGTCTDDLDCSSALCSAGICTGQTCSDDLKDQDESDVDCGGSSCAQCAPGKACSSALDCAGGACTADVCRAPTCNDGLENQNESDVDCGGKCAPCAKGENCVTAADCNRALCSGGKCRSQSCSDGFSNQDETDVDCGGPSGCARCAVNQHCVTSSDCDRASCSKGTCQPVTCSDGVLNGSETDVDCGGSCKRCEALAACLVANDCDSSVCTKATHRCAAPTCDDGVLNGTEPTADCGASCPNRCQIADTCTAAADCITNTCTNQRCVTSDIPLPTTGWIATASHTEVQASSAASNALDGKLNTYWTSGAGQMPGMWFMVDMLKPQTFFSVAILETSAPDDFGESIRISSSLDGTTFSVLRTDIAGSHSLKIPFADAQTARYLKLEVLTSPGGGGLWWRIDELQVLQ